MHILRDYTTSQLQARQLCLPLPSITVVAVPIFEWVLHFISFAPGSVSIEYDAYHGTEQRQSYIPDYVCLGACLCWKHICVFCVQAGIYMGSWGPLLAVHTNQHWRPFSVFEEHMGQDPVGQVTPLIEMGQAMEVMPFLAYSDAGD